VASSSSVAQSISSALSSSSLAPSSDSRDWSWLENVEKGADAVTMADLPPLGAMLDGCFNISIKPMDSLKTGPRNEVLEYYSSFDNIGCLVPLEHKDPSKGYYPISGADHE
jgi:hypothetical protein